MDNAGYFKYVKTQTSGMGGSAWPVGELLPICARAAIESNTAFLMPTMVIYGVLLN